MNTDSHTLLVSRKQHSHFGITSNTDYDTVEELKQRYPEHVVLEHNAGDWGLGFSHTELRFRPYDPRFPFIDAIVMHYGSENNPVGPNTGVYEWLHVPDMHIQNVRALRDALTKLLGE